MKTSEGTIKGYDCVKSFRRIKTKLSKELAGLSNEEILKRFQKSSREFEKQAKFNK
jgi:cell fate (sporulation/competence/biofilm development) regulator YmcA (YheA/YmcA/DUF963 family)